jgi:hypothetical protein
VFGPRGVFRKGTVTFAMNLQAAKSKAVSCQMYCIQRLVFCKALLELRILAAVVAIPWIQQQTQHTCGRPTDAVHNCRPCNLKCVRLCVCVCVCVVGVWWVCGVCVCLVCVCVCVWCVVCLVCVCVCVCDCLTQIGQTWDVHCTPTMLIWVVTPCRWACNSLCFEVH